MWKRFLCWWFGHKVMLKAFTGNVIKVTHPLNMYPVDTPMYKWERQRHCIRCGYDGGITQSHVHIGELAHEDLVELGRLANWDVMGDWERRQKAAGILRHIGKETLIKEGADGK